ncbi:MAG: hypothetical protein AAGI38_07935 [Bacteroidota bacterium]
MSTPRPLMFSTRRAALFGMAMLFVCMLLSFYAGYREGHNRLQQEIATGNIACEQVQKNCCQDQAYP